MTLPTLAIPVAGSSTQGEYALVEACLPAGTELPAHVTHHEDIVLHLLHGELEVTVVRQAKTLARGDSRTLDRGLPRPVRGPRPSRVVALLVPGGLEQILAVVADPVMDPYDRAALLAIGGVQALPAA